MASLDTPARPDQPPSPPQPRHSPLNRPRRPGTRQHTNTRHEPATPCCFRHESRPACAVRLHPPRPLSSPQTPQTTPQPSRRIHHQIRARSGHQTAEPRHLHLMQHPLARRNRPRRSHHQRRQHRRRRTTLASLQPLHRRPGHPSPHRQPPLRHPELRPQRPQLDTQRGTQPSPRSIRRCGVLSGGRAKTRAIVR
jgi:hypothetical protein